MTRAHRLTTQDGSHDGWLIECPACGFGHLFDSRWKFNGDTERPTFTPSMLVHAGPNTPRCHSFVTDGKIRYLGDCSHEMAGQVVELGEVLP